MTTTDLLARGITYGWQVGFHSFVLGFVVYTWTRILDLSPGRTRRRLLEIVLALPLATAALASVVLQHAPEAAWFDSRRILALSVGPVRVWQGMAGVAIVGVLVTVWQEVLPVFERSRARSRHPDPCLLARARALPGWNAVRVAIVESGEPCASVHGTPWRPRLTISDSLVRHLDAPSLAAVLRHEWAHSRPRAWVAMHLLWTARLVQCFNPVALWVFREYSIESEIACDAEAAGDDPIPMARALFVLYEESEEDEEVQRRVLRRRVDILLGRIPSAVHRDQVPTASLVAAVVFWSLLLPWVI